MKITDIFPITILIKTFKEVINMKAIMNIVIVVLIFAFIGFHIVLNKVETFVNQKVTRIQQNSESKIKDYYDESRKVIIHTMQAGETLIDLEQRYDVDRRVIQKANNIQDERLLAIRQEIIIPVRHKAANYSSMRTYH
ncbi:hypothetical protein B6I21_02360 [candidate division KSB1 bacterium 4572_119]|nr:MAG: hypothetical protein B6I21_02360 [candidate division KSB1 bacterium 4572_119]